MGAVDGHVMGASVALRWALDGRQMGKQRIERKILDTLRLGLGSPPPRPHEMALENVSGDDFPMDLHHFPICGGPGVPDGRPMGVHWRWAQTDGHRWAQMGTTNF